MLLMMLLLLLFLAADPPKWAVVGLLIVCNMVLVDVVGRS